MHSNNFKAKLCKKFGCFLIEGLSLLVLALVWRFGCDDRQSKAFKVFELVFFGRDRLGHDWFRLCLLGNLARLAHADPESL